MTQFFEVLIKCFASLFVGALVGSERSRHGRAAGVRTHILVALGACMTSMTSLYINSVLGGTGDLARLPAQVISGIGFLGAGMIVLKNNNIISGLTTAAGVWTTATIGIAIGYGFYTGAAVITVLFLISIIFLRRFEKDKKATQVIYIELDDPHKVNDFKKSIDEMLSYEYDFNIFAPKSNHGDYVGINIIKNRNQAIDIEKIRTIDGVVLAIEEFR